MAKDLFGNDVEDTRTLILDGEDHTIFTPSEEDAPRALVGALAALPFDGDGKATRDRCPIYFGSGGCYIFFTPDLVMVISPNELGIMTDAYIGLLTSIENLVRNQSD